ncbi:MAG: L-rhamnose mutarotase [Rhodothermales bacterium]
MRIAFKMHVYADRVDEYIERHNPIWPELDTVLKEHGVRTYSIFLDRETNELFAYADIEDLDAWQRVAETDVCRRWWKHMSPLMATNDNDSPTTTELEEVFHIEE